MALCEMGPVADCVINIAEPAEAVVTPLCDHDPSAIMIK